MAIFSFLATPLGWVMKWIYALLQNYGWTIIVFTVLARVIMIPLSISQQKNSARMQAYQPMIQDIQKKWANDKNRQNQEMQKFYEENNIKMTAGCLPMVVNMLVIFGMIYAIQAPLNYILQVPQEQVDYGVAIVQNSDVITTEIDPNNTYTVESILIGEIKNHPEVFIEGVEATNAEGETYHAAMDPTVVEQVKDFNFEFAGFNLAVAPTLEFNKYLILPILSILTMFASQFVIMKLTPGQQQMGGQMIIMTLVMGVMFGFYAFRVPVGFSLYYTVSNIVMLLQQVLMRKLYNPVKIRAQIEEEMEARRAEKKSKKKVKVKDDKGEVLDIDVSEAELNKLRLARARELDAKRYAEEEAQSAEEQEAAEKARELDDKKYGGVSEKAKSEKESSAESDDDADDLDESEGEEKTTENSKENTDENVVENTAEKAEKSAASSKEYKPGRRKRASQKHKEEPSFADKERAAEQEKISKETEEA